MKTNRGPDFRAFFISELMEDVMVDERSNVVPLWMGVVRDAVEKFKEASVEEQDVICVGLGQKCGTKAAERKARELFAAARPKPEVQYKRVDGVLYYSAGGGWRRWIGPPPKQVVAEQVKEAKPVDVEPTDLEMSAADVVGMSAEEVAAALVGDSVEVKPGVRVKTGLKATSKAFQHSKTPTGIPASLENAIMAVAMLRLECRYDLFHDRNIVCKHDCGLKGDDDFDKVGLKVRQIVLKQYGFDPAISHILDAIQLECLNHMFDPVRDYLDGLKWDGVKRLDKWLVTYCKARDTKLNRAIGRTVLIAGVRRVKEPGVKFDYIMVLEGPQGGGKSTMLKILAGEENFSDAEILGADGREQQEAVQGVWIYELAELEGLGRSDVTKVKLFASKTHDKARPAYGRSRVDRPRRCVFVATTNDPTYLRDRTGNRRFWPVEVGMIDLQAIKRDRDQLWAEAVVAEATGEALVIPQVLWPDVEAQQKAKMEDDPWENILFGELERWMVLGGAKVAGGLTKMSDKDGEPEWRVGSDWLLTDVLQIPKERQGNNHAKRLAAVMRDLGWRHPEAPIRIGKVVRRGFVKSCEQ